MSQDKQLRRFMVQHADGSRSGPLNAQAIRSLAADGTIGRDDQIQQVGKDEWHPASSIKGLSFGRISAVAAPQLGIVDEESTPMSQRMVESLAKQTGFSTIKFGNLADALAADHNQRPAALWVIERGWSENKGADRIRWLVLDEERADAAGLSIQSLTDAVAATIDTTRSRRKPARVSRRKPKQMQGSGESEGGAAALFAIGALVALIGIGIIEGGPAVVITLAFGTFFALVAAGERRGIDVVVGSYTVASWIVFIVLLFLDMASKA